MSVPEVSLITPTRDRPVAFDLCIRWMRQQTFRRPVHWIVVDDGDEPINTVQLTNLPIFWRIEYVRRQPCEIRNTLPQNMTEALPRAAMAEKILIIEDDEYYAANYIDAMVSYLNSFDTFGEGPARYYNVIERSWKIPKLVHHASLCRTGFRRSLLPHMMKATACALAKGDPWIDLRFWGIRETPFPDGYTKEVRPDLGLSVGIKGLPGRGGLGSNHRPGALCYLDPEMTKLQSWIGKDAALYAPFFDREQSQNSMVRCQPKADIQSGGMHVKTDSSDGEGGDPQGPQQDKERRQRWKSEANAERLAWRLRGNPGV